MTLVSGSPLYDHLHLQRTLYSALSCRRACNLGQLYQLADPMAETSDGAAERSSWLVWQTPHGSGLATACRINVDHLRRLCSRSCPCKQPPRRRKAGRLQCVAISSLRNSDGPSPYTWAMLPSSSCWRRLHGTARTHLNCRLGEIHLSWESECFVLFFSHTRKEFWLGGMAACHDGMLR